MRVGTMPKLSTKLDLLEDAGYRYNFDRMMYVNPSAKKAFSYEFVHDNGEEIIQRGIEETNDTMGWRFYFNDPPPERVRQDLARVLG
jgi:hypothetical protein